MRQFDQENSPFIDDDSLYTLPETVLFTTDATVDCKVVSPKIPVGLKEKLKVKLENLVNNGVIQYVYEPTVWVYLLVLACAITHQSHGQGTVLESCQRHIVQLNESMDPLRWAVDGTASTSGCVLPFVRHHNHNSH